MSWRSLVSAAAAGLLACTSPTPEPSPPPDAPPAALPQAAPAPVPAYVVTIASLRRTPSNDARVADPAGGPKKVSNWLATLHRGEAVERGQEGGGEWCEATTSDGARGFIKCRYLLDAKGVRLATLIDGTEHFDRPELVAVAKGKIKAGTLLFVVAERPPFVQVNTVGRSKTWLLADRLETAPAELELAKLLARARWLASSEGKAEDIAALLEIARERFSSTKLAATLEAEFPPPTGDQPEAEPDAAGTPSAPE